MPNRIIKESLKLSPQVDQLSWFEECVWNRLIVTVDDYGRYDGRSVALKSELFPLKEKVTKRQIESAIEHLAQVGLIVCYEVDGRPYIAIPTWSKHQRIQTKKSKFPDIPSSTVSHGDSPLESNPIQSNTESNPNTNSASSDKPKTQRFQKPTLDEIKSYIREKGYTVDAERFYNYYESNGWMVGKNHMKNYRAALATWQSKEPKQKPGRAKGEINVDDLPF